MKNKSTIVLRLVIILIGLLVAFICTIVLPYGIITDKTNLYRPILIGMYLPAIPFFIALVQGYQILNYIDKNQAFTKQTVKALRIIKESAGVIFGLYTLGSPFIFIAADRDDAPGVVAIALVIIFISFVVAVFAAVLEKLFQNAVEIKSENDLTV